MDIPTLFEDNDILVINKPSGIVTNRAESVKGETLQEWAEEKLKIQDSRFTIEEADFVKRAGIVHRLDKETSGILIIAKTPEAFGSLQRQFKERTVKKTYLAFVHGELVPAEGEIRAPIGRLPWNRERFGVVPGGREALTMYKRVSCCVSRATGELLSLVELYPQTGRTHQIRVHLKYIGYPVVGDSLYAGRKVGRSDRAWAERVMLHAWRISFAHPTSGKTLALEAPIPDDMLRIINLKHEIRNSEQDV